MRNLTLLLLLAYGCKGRIAGGESNTQANNTTPINCRGLQAESTKEMDPDEIFDLTSLCVFNRDTHTVQIRVLGETFQKILDDGCAGRDSGFGHVIEMKLDGIAIKNVGFKVRGNTSKCNAKRQFKFNFAAKKVFSVFNGKKQIKDFPENDDRTFFGLSGFSVRTSMNDPTNIREKVSSKIFTAAEDLKRTGERGGLAYRLSFAKFFVSFNRPANQGPEGSFNRLMDGFYYDYKGFYSIAEHIDKTFLASRFLNPGEKLKGFYLYQADLARAAFARDKFKKEGWSAELANGKAVDTAQDQTDAEKKLFELFDLLGSAATESQLSVQIDVDNLANYVAGAMLAGHWDSLLGNANNDFLLFNGKTGKWQVLTWDLDNSLGAQRGQFLALMNDNIFSPATANKAKLFTEVFDARNPGFRRTLQDRFKAMINGFASETTFNQTIDEFEQDAKGAMENWEGYNHQAYEDIKNFEKSRRQKIGPQL